MSRWTWSFIVIAALAIMAGFYYLQRIREAPAPAAPARVQTPAPTPPQPQPKQESQIQHPLEQAQGEASEQLPPLDGSDQAMRDALAGLIGLGQVDKFLEMKGFVRHLVISVDNAPREKLVRQLVPLKAIPGRFQTAGGGQSLTISAENYRRYTPAVNVMEALDAKKLVNVYVHFYPLFQQAYKELGYPSGYFNDRLVDAIDDMLGAPQIQGPVRLVRPKLMYQYADPALEELSAGQKFLIRMGPDNEARVKAKLTQIRQEIISRSGSN